MDRLPGVFWGKDGKFLCLTKKLLPIEKICYNKLAIEEQVISGGYELYFDIDLPLECEYRQRKEQKMELLIIRHGDPDYTIDSLTEKGWREAEYLSEKLIKMDIQDFYVSPLGRARDTASCTLKKLNREAEVCPWLREFNPRIHRPDVTDRKMITWDWLPQDWTKIPEFYDYDSWWKVSVLQEANVKAEYDWVTENFDKLLEEHGYVREGNY